MNSTPEQLRFASIPSHSVRADFAGGGLSSDLGPFLLRGVDLHPMFKLGAARLPFDDDAALASGATISRFAHAACRQDIHRVSEALGGQLLPASPARQKA